VLLLVLVIVGVEVVDGVDWVVLGDGVAFVVTGGGCCDCVVLSVVPRLAVAVVVSDVGA
jgi:hypothetical protein